MITYNIANYNEKAYFGEYFVAILLEQDILCDIIKEKE